MYAPDDSAYFGMVVSYECKMFIKLTYWSKICKQVRSLPEWSLFALHYKDMGTYSQHFIFFVTYEWAQ